MDPLSVIASVIAISEAFGAGVKTLKCLSNTTSEFNDMLGELSALQAWLDQLRLTTESLSASMADYQMHGDLLGRLELAKVELSQIVNAMEEVRKRLIGHRDRHEKEKSIVDLLGLNRKGQVKISVVAWQRVRGKVQKIRDRAKRCREELSGCLDLVTLSQQIQQHQTSREILTISHTQYSLMQETLTTFERRFDALQSMMLDQRRGLLDSSPSKVAVEYKGDGNHTTQVQGQLTATIATKEEQFSVTQIQVPIRQKCSRYCKCQCHRNSAIRTPSWTRALIGSMILQYNGAIKLDTNPCDIPGCQSGKGREFSLAYSFPSWLVRRAVHLSASWGSLTGMGASLHLTVPSICEASTWVWEALECDDAAYLQSMIQNRLLLPNHVSECGQTFLLRAAKEDAAQSLSVLLKMGFKPSFQELQTGLTARIYAQRRWLMNYRDSLSPHPGDSTWELALLELATTKTATTNNDMESSDPPSTMIRDAALGINDVTLSDALAIEASSINDFDDLGFTPLHWAAARGTPQQIDLLLQHGADLEIKDPYTGRSPLHIAVRARNRQVVSHLLSRGASISSTDRYGFWVSHNCKDPEVMEILLGEVGRRQVLVDALDPWGYTPLIGNITVSSKTYLKVVDVLARSGANLEVRDYRGRTAIIEATRRGNEHVVEKLLSFGARVDATDNDGLGILHYTAIKTDIRMMNCLRKLEIQGLDPDRQDRFGWSPVGLYRERMFRVWRPGQTRPKQRDVFAFYALVMEIRQRNWHRGLFLESKELLESEGSLQNTRRWLGDQWQALHDVEWFGDLVFSMESDFWYPERYPMGRCDIDYDTGILFGQSEDLSSSRPGEEVTTSFPQDQDENEDNDEFFDAME